MTGDTLITLIAAFVGGGASAKLIDWLRYRNQDNASALKTASESQTQTLTVQSTLLAQWITDASTAQQKIAELIRESGSKDVKLKQKDVALREALHAVSLCKESLEKCRKKRGCTEGE